MAPPMVPAEAQPTAMPTAQFTTLTAAGAGGRIGIIIMVLANATAGRPGRRVGRGSDEFCGCVHKF